MELDEDYCTLSEKAASLEFQPAHCSNAAKPLVSFGV